METSRSKQRTLQMVQLAILLALVIVLQLWGSNVKIGPTSFSLVLIPIVIGGILLGPRGGGLLGLAFGLITLIAGITGTDAFTFILFQDHPVITALICLGKGVLAGLGAAWIFRLVEKKNKYAAVFAASAAAPVINTGLFILGALFLSDTLSANFVADGSTVLYFLVIGCAGINFIIEFFVNLIVSPAIYRVITAISGRLGKES